MGPPKVNQKIGKNPWLKYAKIDTPITLSSYEFYSVKQIYFLEIIK